MNGERVLLLLALCSIHRSNDVTAESMKGGESVKGVVAYLTSESKDDVRAACCVPRVVAYGARQHAGMARAMGRISRPDVCCVACVVSHHDPARHVPFLQRGRTTSIVAEAP